MVVIALYNLTGHSITGYAYNMLPEMGFPKQKSTSKLVPALAVAVGLLFTFTTGLAGYKIGTHKTTVDDHDDTMTSSITLPKDATVTAECEAARGKQYILPKDIPMGPIYDVHNGKVVAIEYLVGHDELENKSEMFKDLALPKADYDHISIMPTAAHAGLNEAHFHVVSYLIPQSEADKITCSSSSTSSDMNTMDSMSESH
jgi:hypothetical protein